jgi:hypothetical protein
MASKKPRWKRNIIKSKTIKNDLRIIEDFNA